MTITETAITETTRHYRSIFDRRTPEEMRQLAHIKRFMERLSADPEFRKALADNINEPQVVTERYRIDADPREMLPLFHRGYLKYRFTEEEARWPLAYAWDAYMRDMFRHRDMLRGQGNMEGVHPRFHAWRERQIARAMSELGSSGPAITHPIVTFELSEGCTVGCWFCGLSAERFRGYLPYEPNAALWREVVGAVNDLFGTASQTGFCYWATDPSDNPDYDRFITDYYHITGALPQTTTAAPLKDEALTRRVLALFDQYRTVTNRFSVLTVKQLDRIHAAFTAEELMGVELIMQNRDSLIGKAGAGRTRERIAKLRASGKAEGLREISDDHMTIACVSGFLVNMMNRTVQLITPVPSTERWPLGYRILGERRFTSGAEFRAALQSLIADDMVEDLPGWWPAKFRPDLRYEPRPDGFLLHSRMMQHRVTNPVCGRFVADLVAEGRSTVSEIVERAIDHGIDMLEVADFMDRLFVSGLLVEPDDPRANEVPALAAAGA